MPQPPLYAIDHAVQRRREAFRSAADGSARVLGQASSLAQGPQDGPDEGEADGTDGATPDGEERDIAGRHHVLRLLSAEYLIPLLSNHSQRDALLAATLAPHRGPTAYGPQETLNFFIPDEHRADLVNPLFSHRFLIDPSQPEAQRQSAPVMIWILPRLLAAHAALFSHPPSQPDFQVLAVHLLKGAGQLIGRASLLTPSRPLILPLLRAAFALALRAFILSHRPAVSHKDADMDALLADSRVVPPPPPGKALLTMLPDGLAFPAASVPKCPAGGRVLWLREDDLTLKVDLSVPSSSPDDSKAATAAAAARFARALLSSLVILLAPLSRSDPARFATLAISVTCTWLDNWRLDLATVSAPPPGGTPMSHVPATVASLRVFAATELVRLVEGGMVGVACHVPSAFEYALAQLEIYAPFRTADAAPSERFSPSQAEIYAQLAILKGTTGLLQAVRGAKCPELISTAQALLLPRSGDLLAFATAPCATFDAGTDTSMSGSALGAEDQRMMEDILNWSKACAWEALLLIASPLRTNVVPSRSVLADAVTRLLAGQAAAHPSQSQPALTFLAASTAGAISTISAPAWMLPSQVHDTRMLLAQEQAPTPAKRADSSDFAYQEEQHESKRARPNILARHEESVLRLGLDARWTLEEIIASPPLPLDPLADSDQFARAALRMCAYAHGVLSPQGAAENLGNWACLVCDARVPSLSATASPTFALGISRRIAMPAGANGAANNIPELITAPLATPDAGKMLDRIVRRLKIALGTHPSVSSSPSGTIVTQPTQMAADDKVDTLGVAKAIQAFRRIIAHCDESAVLDMDYIAFFEMVKTALVVRSRACNVAAMTLLVTVGRRFEHLHTVRKKPNSLLVLNCISALHTQLLKTQDSRIIATTVESLGRVGQLSFDTLLENAVLKLVESLGSGPYTASLAYTQISALARLKGGTTYQLLLPYMGQLSVLVVLKSETTPSLLEGVLRLTGVSKSKFLQATKNDVVPALIKNQQLKLLQDVARTLEVTVSKLCNDTMPFILCSTLMVEPRSRHVVIDQLLGMFPGQVSFLQLLRPYQADVLGQLVLALGQDERQGWARSALEYVYNTSLNSRGASQRGSKNVPTFIAWLGSEAMAIHSWLCEELDGTHGRRSDSDRRIVIQAFARLIHILGCHVSSIIPQLNTTLTSSLNKPALRLSVLRAWNTLLEGLQASDMSLYLGQTMAALATVWPELDEQEAAQAKVMILGLINLPDAGVGSRDEDAHGVSGAGAAARDVLARVHVAGPILNAMPEWADLRRSHELRGGNRAELEALLDDLASDNAASILQTLIVLRQFLRDKTSFVHLLTSGNQFDPLVGCLLATLLAIPARLDLASTAEQNNLAFECLGLVGAVDPDRVDLRIGSGGRMSTAMVINFDDEDEAADFALLLVRDLLVRAFRTTDNSAHQVKLAYAIQQLLKFCGFTPALLDAVPYTHSTSNTTVTSRSGRVLARWRSLPSHMLDTIGPLLGSHYSVCFKEGQPRSLPLCHSSSTYAEWLQNWTSLLIKATRQTPAGDIFTVFRPVVLEHDLSIAQFILPHLVLAVLVYGTELNRGQIGDELNAVLHALTEPSEIVGQDQAGQQPMILKMAQTVFGLLDHLGVWLRRKLMTAAAHSNARARSTRSANRALNTRDQTQNFEAVALIEGVLINIHPSVLAHASFETQSWARSLLHFEQTVRKTRGTADGYKPNAPGSSDTARKAAEELQDVYEKMHCIYSALDEPDGMEGITTLVVDPSLEHQIREHESTGRWTAAQSCWELKLQNNPTDPDLHKGLLNCLRNLGHYDTMQTHIRGALSQHPEWQSMLGAYEVEGACILSNWEEVARLVDLPSANSDKHALARLLLAIRMSNSDAVQTALTEARQQFGEPMVGSGEPKYERVYESIVNLQAIQDLDYIYTQAWPRLDETKTMLVSRVASTLPSFRVREVLLSAHRSGFNALRSSTLDASDPVAAAWVQTSKFARRADHRQTAYSAMLQAQQLGAHFAFVQRAKLLVLDDQLQSAIQVMNHALAGMDLNPSAMTGLSNSERTATAKAALLRTNIMERTGRYSRNDLLDSYIRVTAIDEKAERSWYAHGHYADSSRDASDQNPLAVDLTVVRSLLHALKCGTKYFFRTLPRVLTIWLDNGESPSLVAACSGGKPDINDPATKSFVEINARISKAVGQLPAYQWLAVFPQLVCRVTHKNELVWKTLRQIIIRVVQEYPAQAMWAVVGGYQSKDSDRRRRFSTILSRVKTASAEIVGLGPERQEQARRQAQNTVKAVEQAVHMAHELLVLCNHAVSNSTKTLSMKHDFPNLVKLPTDHLLLPLQSSLVVSLPATNLLDPKHQPFPPDLPRIKGFDDTIDVMSSLQKPRKITVYSTDGASFNFLCKPKDDLRKDARLMDFDAMINKLLQANADSRRRKLYIRTYGVVTLNEECGLIEWVPNTIGLRHILSALYKTHHKTLYSNEIKGLFDSIRAKPRRAAEIFTQNVLPLYPPVFHEWFVATFPEPSAWLSARLSYARTAAVMSMVGHVLGLGDRHGENILFDASSGDTVHVDLNCLFEKGQTFEIPERVPFRLTNNMVDALGVTGVDGVFRRAAEVSMSILRDNKDSLMSVLEAMIHDPLVEWTPSLKKRGSTGVELRLDEARGALTTVRHKLEGFKRRQAASEMRLTTPNLVDSLIRDATSPTNLALMYIGWASYL